jgi:hypothetical protein
MRLFFIVSLMLPIDSSDCVPMLNSEYSPLSEAFA